MRKSLIIAGIAATALAVALLAWRLADRPSDEAVQAVPQEDCAVADVEYFLQNDPEWASDMLGKSQYRMNGSGCLVSCIASSLTAQGFDIDPGLLNAAFTDHGVYNSEGEILWDKISEAVPGVRAELPARADADKLEDAVAQGFLPIVKVKYMGTGYQHWVMLIGAENGDYLCMDPLNTEKEPLPLSAHGGVIYRYRIVTLE